MTRRDTLRPVPDRRDHASRVALLRQLETAFESQPQMRLTGAQARRLFALREDICQRVLDELVGARLLEQGQDGRYAARTLMQRRSREPV